MSKGKQIKTYWDLIDRPVYKELRELFLKENKWMTVRDVQEKLYPEWKQQRLNKYLNYLVLVGLFEKDRGNRVDGTPTKFRALTNDQFIDKISKEMSNKQVDFFKTLESINNTINNINSEGSNFDPYKYPDQLGLFQAEQYLMYDSRTNQYKLNSNKFYKKYSVFVTPQEFIEYRLTHIKEELINFLKVTGHKTDLKISVEYKKGEKMEI